MDNIKTWEIILPAVIIIVSFVTGIIIRATLVKRLSNLAKKSKSRLDDIFLESLRPVIVLWFVLLGVYISITIMPLIFPESLKYSDFLQKAFQALFIFSVLWFLALLLGKIFFEYSAKFQAKVPAASIIKNSIKIIILTTAFLIILGTLGISITPVLTTLGVGGLAVALALQDTLANFFAGFHIIATQRVKPKDYIKLDSGEEGYVVDITWRDTVLRQLPNNYIIIPNSRLSSAIVINYYRPQRALNLLIEVGVDYSSDLETVERVTLEVAGETLKEVPGGVEKFEAFMRFHTFGDSSINFTVYLRCKEFFDRFLVRHEFIKRLKKRYDQEGINIPFPIRTVIMKQE